MREQRLTERIRFWAKAPPGQRRAKTDPRQLEDSIRRHLSLILNTRRGNVPIAQDYGMPDLTDFLYSYGGTLGELERSLRETVRKYEPRLKSAKVSFDKHEGSDPTVLRFQISGEIAVENEDIQVSFHSHIGNNRKIEIR